MRELSIGVIEELTPTLVPAQVEKLCQSGVELTYERGEIICRQGEPAKHIFLLIEGEAQSTLLNSAGHETLLRIHLPGSILGLTCLATVPWRDASAKTNGARKPHPRLGDRLSHRRHPGRRRHRNRNPDLPAVSAN